MLVWWIFSANWFLLLFNVTLILLNWRLLKKVQYADERFVERIAAAIALEAELARGAQALEREPQ